MNDPGKVFLEKCFQGFRDFFDMNGSGSKKCTSPLIVEPKIGLKGNRNRFE